MALRSRAIQHKSFFWNGVLALNEMGEHNFFDIRLRREDNQVLTVFLHTSDLPPLPLGPEDIIRASFLLENNVGIQTVRYKIADATVYGNLIDDRASTSAEVTLRTDNAEWTFRKSEQGEYLLISLCIEVPASQVRKFLPVL